MKIMKIAAAAVLVTSGVIASFAFVGKKATKVASTDFYYFSGTDRQRIQYGHTTESDLKERSPESNSGADFKDAGNWTTSIQFYSVGSMSQYIGKINFNLDETLPGNGGSDGDLTLQEALNALYANYASNQAMPSSLNVGSCTITVEAADAAH
jgi:hypothetical protein